MDIRIVKRNVCYCAICNDVREIKNAWEAEQETLVENGEQEEAISFPGVPGYMMKDADDYSYLSTEICENCMHTLMKGVNLIINQKLTGVSLSNGNSSNHK